MAAAAVLKLGAMLGKAGGAIAKGGKVAMKVGKRGAKAVAKNTKKTAQNVKKAVQKRKKINKDTFMSRDRAQKKKLEQDKRRREEQSLEQVKKSKQKPSVKKSMPGGGMLQRLIGFLTTVIVGWIVVNLPKIIKSVKGLIKKIKEIYNGITGFFSSVGDFFVGIKDKIGDFINKIKGVDFSKIRDSIKEKIDGIKNGFTNMVDKIKGGLSVLMGKKKEDPKKLAKSGFGGDTSAVTNESKNKISDKEAEIDSVMKDTDNQLIETNKQQNNFDKSISKGQKELKKIGINVNISGEKIDSSVISPQKIMKNNNFSNDSVPDKKSSDNSVNSSVSDQSGKLITSGSTSTTTTTTANNIISKPPTPIDLGSSITPSSTNNEIVIDNIIPAQNQVAQSQGGQGDIIVVESSLNSNVNDSLLLDAAYT